MNYVIMCQPRSGSSYLGELLQLNGVPYFNELFTPEICRTARIWPAHLERQHVDHRIDLAFSVPNAGFKLPYQDSQSSMWATARLARMPDVKVIHVIRDDMLEAFASWIYLNHAGVSMARDDGSLWGTDGKRLDQLKEQPPYRINVDFALQWFSAMDHHRQMIWRLFRWHPYIELPMPDVFTDEGVGKVFNHLRIPWMKVKRPNHVPTPRPRARQLFLNWQALHEAFFHTKWAGLFDEADSIPDV